MSRNEDDENADNDIPHDEEYLNIRTTEYIPDSILYNILIIGIILGFILGFILGSLVTSASICFIKTSDSLNKISDSDSLDKNGDGFFECFKNNTYKPLSIITGVLTGIIFAYPSYKFVDVLYSDKYIRSIL